jgi:hypothetical protein
MPSLPLIVLISATAWMATGLIAWLIFGVWRRILPPEYGKCSKVVLLGPIGFYILYRYWLRVNRIKKLLEGMFGKHKINMSDFKG